MRSCEPWSARPPLLDLVTWYSPGETRRCRHDLSRSQSYAEFLVHALRDWTHPVQDTAPFLLAPGRIHYRTLPLSLRPLRLDPSTTGGTPFLPRGRVHTVRTGTGRSLARSGGPTTPPWVTGHAPSGRASAKAGGSPTSTGTHVMFAQEYAFDSPSAAAGVVTGTGLNGRAHWTHLGPAPPGPESPAFAANSAVHAVPP